MTYQVKFTETTNPAKPAITVEDQTAQNYNTGIKFVGKNYAGYAPIIAENFLHLLENFASSIEPENPVQGQLWYDNTAGVSLLKVYDGTAWTAAGAIKKSSATPTESLKGDLWVDTDNNQLFVYSGSNWLLVGPQFSSGVKTGPDIETITDTDNVDHNVITLWSQDTRIAIVSNDTFIPKITISGFLTIRQGINLNSTDALSSTNPTKFWGVAEKADGLIASNKVITASDILRNDQTSTTNYPLNIRNAGGLSVGSDLSFNIGQEGSVTVLYSKTSGNSIEIKTNSGGTPLSAIHIDADTKVGIGPNNTNPQEALDVAGNIITDGEVIITDNTDSTVVGIGSLRTSGGASVNKTLNVGGDTKVYGNIYVNKLNTNGDPQVGAVLLPGSTAADGLYDIGATDKRFRNIYANNFVGNFNGAFVGSLSGNISGSAAKLASETRFRIEGDVTSNTIAFDGQGDDPAVFTTTISQDIISNKTLIGDANSTDQFLVYRTGTGLGRMTRQTLVSNLPIVPVGAIFPYAGISVPVGYLLCDGSEIGIGDYAELFSTIGYSYKTPSLLIGKNTFALPDLRGRFPLGRDNMDNGNQVQPKDGSNIYIDAGGGSANAVTDVLADTIGAKGGAEGKSLLTRNLPEHKHNLVSTGGKQYYAAGLPSVVDGTAEAGLGLPNESTGYGLPNSGGVISDQLGAPFDVMNPYLTINYIIFTGVL